MLPVLEPPRDNGLPQRLVSFQSKHFDQGAVDYSKIQESAKMAVKHFKGKLDLIYLFCNKTITTTSQGFKTTQTILSAAGIELQPVSNTELLDLICQYPDIYNYFFQPRTRGAANWSTGGTPQITIDSATGAITILPPTLQSEAINSKLLKELICAMICFSEK